MTYTNTIDRATSEGRDAGSVAGSWVVDPGRTSTPDHEYAAGILRMLDEGTLDAPDPLSGEWADGILPRDVLSALDVDEDDPAADDYLSAFEDGYRDAWRETVERDARALLDD